MHAQEWIARFGRRQRVIGAAQLRRVLGRQSKECTWCGGAVPPRRSRWCDQTCVDAFLALQPAAIFQAVSKRDRGVCSQCGCDTERIRRIVNGLRRRREFGGARIYLIALKKEGFRTGLFSVRRLWEADHIVPVCEGGGLCRADGYRTLCQPCHKRVTADLARRRRKAA